jgi:predicted nucleic acid-binding protein
MRVKRYVLDANIWFSYFISQQETKLASIILQNDLTVFYCDELIEEIKRVSTNKRIQKKNKI